MATITTMITADTIMGDEQYRFPPQAFLRLQSWLSPAFPTGAYSYSHGLEWAVEAGDVHDRSSLAAADRLPSAYLVSAVLWLLFGIRVWGYQF
jgi:hypothetical protein